MQRADVARGAAFTVEVDGSAVQAYEGETVLGTLWACGVRRLRATPLKGEPRGFLCGMGVCFDCLVQVDERLNVRACLEAVRPGMKIRTGKTDAG